MARPDVNAVCQLGVETTSGSNVTAGRRLSSVGFQFGPRLQSAFYRQPGNKYPTTGVRHRQWAEGSYDGILSYAEIIYPLSSNFGHAGTPVTVDTSARRWTFSPNSTTADTIRTYTMQVGDATAAQEIAYGHFNGLTINFGQDDLTISGDVIGQAVDNTVSLDSASQLAEAPVSIADVDWYLDSTYGGIGTTKITDVLEATLTIPAKQTAKFVQNTSYAAWRELVETAAEQTMLSLTIEYNSQTRAFVDAMNADSLPLRYVQCKALGNVIGATTQQETFKGNFACKLESLSPRRNVQSIFAYDLSFRLMHDATMGRALEFEVINLLTAL